MYLCVYYVLVVYGCMYDVAVAGVALWYWRVIVYSLVCCAVSKLRWDSARSPKCCGMSVMLSVMLYVYYVRCVHGAGCLWRCVCCGGGGGVVVLAGDIV
jgi:hypothetical protein